MLNFLRRLTPRSLITAYHRGLAWTATQWYRRPSRSMTVIGVTGTDGKTTTATIIADLLTSAGHQVGLISSVYYQLGSRRWLNAGHMTMLGRFGLPRLLRQMVEAGCQYAVLEVSSEGLAQYRHSGIDFDVAVITNLSPEHIKAHGSFVRYRQAKEILFAQVATGNHKRRRDGQPIKKVAVVNLDDPSAREFLKFPVEEQYGITLRLPPPASLVPADHIFTAERIRREPGRSLFSLAGHEFELPVPGDYNISNALEALAVASALGVGWSALQSGLRQVAPIPGRWQEVPTRRSWRVIVDYALTPRALELFYRALKQSGANRIIAVFGAAGGGRDSWKRPELGRIGANHSAAVVITTDDPYDEDPARIAGEIMSGVPADKRSQVEIILDRRLAIRRALGLAQPGDVVAITGMGAETSMMIKGQAVAWNDPAVVQEELDRLA